MRARVKIPSTHIYARWCVPVIPGLGGSRVRVPGAHWPHCGHSESRLSERPASKVRWRGWVRRSVVRVPDVNSDTLSMTPRVHAMEGEDQLLPFVL